MNDKPVNPDEQIGPADSSTASLPPVNRAPEGDVDAPNDAPSEDKPASDNPDGIARFFSSIREYGLTRGKDRFLGGVASGVAARWNLGTGLVRFLFFITLFLGGFGLLLYGVLWLLLPEPDGRIHAEETIRGRFDSAVIPATLFIIAGLDNNPDPIGVSWGSPWGVTWGGFWIVAILALLAVFAKLLGGSRDPEEKAKARKASRVIWGIFWSVISLLVAALITLALFSVRIGDSLRSYGESEVTLTSVSDAAAGVSFGTGENSLDLREMESGNVTIPVRQSLGDLTILLPEDRNVTADVSVNVGEALWDQDGDFKVHSGVGINSRFGEAGKNTITLDVSMGVGKVTFK